ncbi:MAG: hypothetical protein U0L03_00845 [Succinivibrionaceae bacterium]|nr:hypothetical protein [Succinivibrionaceae bacterium]
MKKICAIAAAVVAFSCLSAQAADLPAGWEIDQANTDKAAENFTFVNKSINATVNVTKVKGANTTENLEAVAKESAKQLSCSSVVPAVDGFSLSECPNNLHVYIEPDTDGYSVITAICEGDACDEANNLINELIRIGSEE